MLRITQLPEADGSTRLRLEGRLVGAAVGELARVCDELETRGAAVRLDLAGVSFADREGVALVRALVRGSAALEACTPFLALQIEE